MQNVYFRCGFYVSVFTDDAAQAAAKLQGMVRSWNHLDEDPPCETITHEEYLANCGFGRTPGKCYTWIFNPENKSAKPSWW